MSLICKPVPLNPHETMASDRKKKQYSVMNVVSRGSYGVVYRALDNRSGEIVAIKHELMGLSKSTKREIKILESLPPHRSIVELKKVEVDDWGRVLVVMEFLPCDLSRVIRARKMPFTVLQVKIMMRQILDGVCFLHQNGVMHRDLKPANILINQKDQIKICDFGLSRWENPSGCGSYTPGVVTLWYRAPEILMGETNYTNAIDMWSVGCIMAELLVRKVLFPGKTEIHQLGYTNCTLSPTFPILLSNAVSMLTAAGLHLLLSLLQFHPNTRISAKDALNHPWFLET